MYSEFLFESIQKPCSYIDRIKKQIYFIFDSYYLNTKFNNFGINWYNLVENEIINTLQKEDPRIQIIELKIIKDSIKINFICKNEIESVTWRRNEN